MFDSHCHLTDAAFAGEVSAVVARARSAGVRGMVTIASDAADAARALALASAHGGVWSSAGIHPHASGAAHDRDLQAVRALLADGRVVAVGETGLDYHYDNSPRARQRELFAWHLELAAEYRKPVVVHSREADADTIALIASGPRCPGILHCFSGGTELLRAGLDAGWYISFAGPVTYKRFGGADLLLAVQVDRL
ncbi:MAG: TatD family deoxyribonuclease, partial [Gemmatimonadetes bacterium]|nr:TatD family deoxyribonuclease [Gemmatimonadota bacterium]